MQTGIPGIDEMMNGGLPVGRTTLVAGSAGSGKTIFALQFLMNGMREDEGAVFVTFEEEPRDVRKNVESLGWDLARYEESGSFAIVDVSPSTEHEVVLAGSFDLGALLSRIAEEE